MFYLISDSYWRYLHHRDSYREHGIHIRGQVPHFDKEWRLLRCLGDDVTPWELGKSAQA